MKIVVVEDEEMMRKVIYKGLSQRGHKVITAADGMEGLVTLIDEEPDIAIIDINLPFMDGPSIIKEVNNFSSTTNFIFISSHSSEALADHNMSHARFIQKPFTLKQLSKEVSKFV